MTISVIVPIYKVEAYLRQCVDSILAQTYTDLDIVLVDDGSPDNCPAICDAYVRQDARVQVVHKPNGGLMSARQAGLRVAKGGVCRLCRRRRLDRAGYVCPLCGSDHAVCAGYGALRVLLCLCGP